MVQPVSPLVLAPEWLAHRYDDTRDAVYFLKADRALRHRVPFLTDVNLAGANNPVVVPRREAVAAAPPPAIQHFIFHSAYCCSTLLANALDRSSVATTFKEPVILNDLVGWAQRGASAAQVNAILADTLTLLARPFGEGEASVLKPSNVCNALAPAMLQVRPSARAILLYAPLPAFLTSIAAKGLWGRLWVRDLLVKQLGQGLLAGLGFEPNDLLLVTDLQAAAIGWLAQARLFADLTRRWPERVRTLDSEVLVAEPKQTLHAVSALFGLGLSEADLDDTVANEFTRNAKDGSAFAPGQRTTERSTNESLHSDEIVKVADWAAAVGANADVALIMPAPLVV